SWHFQSTANSDTRWRRHPTALCREHHPARHQLADQRAYLSSGFCLPGIVRRDCHLQRPCEDLAGGDAEAAVALLPCAAAPILRAAWCSWRNQSNDCTYCTYLMYDMNEVQS